MKITLPYQNHEQYIVLKQHWIFCTKEDAGWLYIVEKFIGSRFSRVPFLDKMPQVRLRFL